MEYEEIFLDVYEYMRENDYKSHDPYDFLSSPHINPKSKTLSVLGTQFLKYFPLNIRPALDIEEKQNLQSLILPVRSLINYMRANGQDDRFVEDIDYLVEKVLNHAKEKNGLSWSRIDYNFQSTTGLQKKSSSITFLTALSGHMFVDLYEFFEDEKYLEMANKIGKFLLQVDKYEKDDKVCFYYTTDIKDRIYNASAFACGFLTRLFTHSGKEEYLDLAEKGFNYIANGQNENGSWDYGISSDGKLLTLKDYHQGFVLDSLHHYLEYIGEKENYFKAYEKGLEFYRNKQFFDDGRSVYRYPIKWPIDIHNQAQGIITFSKARNYDSNLMEFAETIAFWTIENMFDSDQGYFYYQKWPLIVNKISYMRWSQAWMCFALSVLLKNKR